MYDVEVTVVIEDDDAQTNVAVPAYNEEILPLNVEFSGMSHNEESVINGEVNTENPAPVPANNNDNMSLDKEE